MKINEKAIVAAVIVAVTATISIVSSRERRVSAQELPTLTFSQKVPFADRQKIRANLAKAFDAVKGDEKSGDANPALVAEIRERGSIDRFHELETCLEPRNPCDIPQTEPRSSDIYVTDQAVKELQGLRMAFSQLSAQDQADVSADLAQATEWALANIDDNVREEGLRLARLVLPPEERVRAVIASLQDSVSGPLYDFGLGILREQKDILRPEQEEFYIQTMRSGGFYASEEVARQILPYLNEHNIARFKELQSELPAESNTAVFLKNNIKEYLMIAQGG